MAGRLNAKEARREQPIYRRRRHATLIRKIALPLEAHS
jgi:hypothetical protein